MSGKKLTDRKEIIEGPAGVNDSFQIAAIEMKQFVNEKDKPTKKTAKTVVPNSTSKEVLSTELTEGMTIKAVPENSRGER